MFKEEEANEGEMLEFNQMDRPHKGDSDNDGPYSDECQILDAESDNHTISSSSLRSYDDYYFDIYRE
ncbi:Oidioi.mRNA.OKI2018_I69.chr2.g7948.t1.cds [Oikopleura dioica]|uniref:Oidioi.mRNA.OKI2018_I69.chr2.g7948.t1.cds n=1 Tax=Oikopleura dioica TaxID=34765 RepID=A0ABN7T7R5_OIKDI|nr:Oidioi.mRNA.OKI2018_I69.chr2.g7948.t1.cds [Oikopleura dioica]